jgi:putative transposase
MSYTKIWVHAVWGTKGRQPILSNGLRRKFLDHLLQHAVSREIEIGLLNCWVDHVHCLIRLQPGQNIEEVLKIIKRESSHWINMNHLTEKRFNWSGDYYAASVSEGNLNGVKNYIQHQERHHSHRTFREEIAAYFEAGTLMQQAVGDQGNQDQDHKEVSRDKNHPETGLFGKEQLVEQD